MKKSNYQLLLLEREDTIRLLHSFEFGCAETKKEQSERLQQYRDNLRKLSHLCEKIYEMTDEEYQIQGDIYKYPDYSFTLQRKGEVKRFLIEKGIQLAHYWNYAKLSPDLSYYWMNPLATAVENDWSIVLNNIPERKLIVFMIPANTFDVGEKGNSFIRRSDKTHYLDMKIEDGTYMDNVSNNKLSDFIISIINY